MDKPAYWTPRSEIKEGVTSLSRVDAADSGVVMRGHAWSVD